MISRQECYHLHEQKLLLLLEAYASLGILRAFKCCHAKECCQVLITQHALPAATSLVSAVMLIMLCSKKAQADTCEHKAAQQEHSHPWLQLKHVNGYTGEHCSVQAATL